jgi:hypothetical protein
MTFVKGTLLDYFNYFFARGGVSLLIKEDRHRDPALKIPDHVRDYPKICLLYEIDAVVPVADLVVTSEGVAATLSFGRVPHSTFVPWDVVEVMMVPPEGERCQTEQPAPKPRHLKLV